MRRNGTRICALLCCLLLCTGVITSALAAPAEDCPGGCSHEAAIGTTHYDTLAEALSAATDGCTVTVLANITGSYTVDKAITLDLGGKTLTGLNGSSEGLLNVTKDLTIKNGTLTTAAGACLYAENCAVTVDKTVTLLATDEAAALSLHSAGKLTVIGGTFTAKGDIIVLDIGDDKTMEASITGGKFYTETGETISIISGTNATAPADFVIGGTYNQVPSAYVPDYCRINDNGDGTYTVTAEYSVTFAGNGASGSMASIKADRDSVITLPNCTYTAPAGKHFAGWEIGGKTYAPGASYAVNGDLTLNALWASHSGGTATCIALAKCSSCGASYGSYSRHNLVTTGGSAATCTEPGITAHSRCTTCGSYFSGGVSISASSLSIPALGHEMVSVEGIKATCTEEGLVKHEKCAHCGLLQSEGKDITQEALVIPATGHKLEKVAAVASTCTEPGTEAHQRCSLCNALFLGSKEVKSEDLTVTVGSHVLSDWESDAATHWKTCNECGDIFRQHSHKDSDGNSSCDDCGYTLPTTGEAASTKKSDSFSPLFLIPVIAAVVIAAGGVVIAVRKKPH